MGCRGVACSGNTGHGRRTARADFQKVVPQPKAVNIELLMQLEIVPLTALVFILATERPSGMIIGIAIMAAILGALHRISLHLWPGAMFPCPSVSRH